MSSVFQLLGMIFDDISEEARFLFDWQDGSLFIGCNNCDIVGDFILPLCEGQDFGQYQLIEKSSWFVAVIKISKCPEYQISEITFIDDADNSVTCNVGTAILEELDNKGIDDTYLKICREIAKKCGFLVDKI